MEERRIDDGRQCWTLNKLLITAGCCRLLLVLYARIHDYLFEVAFTDIDYSVYSDAAQFAFSGGSPYDRSTYRYTPLLAYILIPNLQFPEFDPVLLYLANLVTDDQRYENYPLVSRCFQAKTYYTGKLLFCSLDVLAAYLMHRLMLMRNVCHSTSIGYIAIFWLFNPLTAIISARGNADVVVCVAVLLTLYFIQCDRYIVGALVHGLAAIHLKLYPVIYLPSIFLHLACTNKSQTIRDFLCRILFNGKGWGYVLLALSSFSCVTLICYQLFGDVFLQESLLYHFSRADIKHNFSPYFYPLYLANRDQYWTKVIGLTAFLPQAALVVACALRYADDLPFCWFVTTLCFVTLNKVCTSQYFIWYVCLLPLAYPSVHKRISASKFAVITFLWFSAQGLWLFFAYLLEFRGSNVFVYVWLCSLLFMCVNVYLIYVFLKSFVDSDHQQTCEKKTA